MCVCVCVGMQKYPDIIIYIPGNEIYIITRLVFEAQFRVPQLTLRVGLISSYNKILIEIKII